MIKINYRKILRYLNFFLFSKKIWHYPRKSKILIFDAESKEFLLEYTKSWNPEILEVRGKILNIPVFFSSLLINGNKINAYLDTYISKVSPKLIITFIDNNQKFYQLKNRHKNITTLLLQNGWRSYYRDIFELLDKKKILALNKPEYKIDYMMLFGKIVSFEYKKHIDSSFLSIGSLKNNHVPITAKSYLDTIVFISQWEEGIIEVNGKYLSQNEYGKPIDKPIHNFLSEYSKKNNKRILILPRKNKNDPTRKNEEKYYEELYKSFNDKTPQFINKTSFHSSYQAIDSAGVVVGIDSTLLYESLSRGNRTSIFSARGNLLGVHGFSYGWPGKFSPKGLFWSDHINKEYFYKIFNYLFSVSDNQWKIDLNIHFPKELMFYDPGNKILKNFIKSTLN